MTPSGEGEMELHVHELACRIVEHLANRPRPPGLSAAECLDALPDDQLGAALTAARVACHYFVEQLRQVSAAPVTVRQEHARDA